MPRRVPLDPALSAAPFSVAEAFAAGVGRGRLAGRDLIRPFHGIRSVNDYGQIAAYAPRLRPGDRFSHTSAAALWGAPLPADLGTVVHVTAGPGLDRPRGAGVLGHRGRGQTAIRGSLPLSDSATTFIELATLLALDDLVAVGDFLVLDPRVLDPNDPRPHISLEALRAVVDASSARGVPLARRAARLVRGGVESRRETHLRLLLQRARLPEPICGYELRTGSGRHIGWFDLAWPEFRTLAEYDGGQHRTSVRQYDRDITRYDAAADEDWRVVRVRKRALVGYPQSVVDRVADALRRGGWAPKGRKRMNDGL